MTDMQSRSIGATPVVVTELGFGGAAIGNLYRAVSNVDALQVVEHAYDAGLRYFDTAPLYGLGLSERRMGLVLADLPRESFVLSCKVGRRLRPGDPRTIASPIFERIPGAHPYFDYSYDGVMRSLEESLLRLGMHSIDVLYLHDVDVANHGTTEAVEQRFREVMDSGGYRAMAALRDQGVVKAIGVGVNEWEWCERFARAADFDCFLLAGRYTLLEQQALESFLPLCEQKGISVVVGGPYNSGILATGAVAGAYYNYVPATPEVLERVRRIEAVCRRHGVELAAAALQFPLHHPVVASVIPGARSIEELDRALELYRAPIPLAFWDELKASGLMRADAPIQGRTA
jgi:D-threo-aldose 1-dehydrogenase